MSQPLLDLQRLLTGRQTMTGRVLAVVSGKARVATAQGIVEVTADPSLGVGDQVMVQGGKATKIKGGGKIPVYYV
ncbi:MAG: hypothetical protein HQL63_00765 [Magnetococcales bacterium]|nr:hypothetical protein [Magnetococcales bacterium]MBF0322370.1 hypothetical protein [Magnetococcales bacterium]